MNGQVAQTITRKCQIPVLSVTVNITISLWDTTTDIVKVQWASKNISNRRTSVPNCTTTAVDALQQKNKEWLQL